MIVVVEEGAYSDVRTNLYSVEDEDVAAFVELCEAVESCPLLIAPHCMSDEPDDYTELRELGILGLLEFPYRRKRWLGLSQSALRLLLRIVQHRIVRPDAYRDLDAPGWGRLEQLAQARLAELDESNQSEMGS